MKCVVCLPQGTGCLLKQLLMVKPLDFNGGEKFCKDTSSKRSNYLKKKLSKIVKPRFLKFGTVPPNLSIHVKIVFWGFDFAKIMSLQYVHDI